MQTAIHNSNTDVGGNSNIMIFKVIVSNHYTDLGSISNRNIQTKVIVIVIQ